MKARWAFGLGLSLLGAGSAAAQMPDQRPATPAPAPAPAPMPAIAAPAACDCQPCDEPPRFFAGVDYMIWQVKGQPVPVPIVTTSSVNNIGILGRDDTLILGGNGNLGFNWISGVRVTGGYILDTQDGWTLEGGIFFLFRKESRQRVASDSAGNPLLASPFIDAVTGAESSLLYAVPGLFSGVVDFGGGSRFTSGEVNLAIPFSESERWRFDVLLGNRYADLSENLDIRSSSTPLEGTPGFAVGGIGVGPGDVAGDVNNFRTRNQLFAAQVGLRAVYNVADGLFFTTTTKLAAGFNRQTVDISGQTFIVPASGAQPTTFDGGLWAVATNIGIQHKTNFAYLSELGLSLGYWMTDSICLTAGYQFVYFGRVVRPGNQIDRIINRSYVPQSATFGGPAEPFRPLVPFSRSDYWAQGMSFGCEVRF